MSELLEIIFVLLSILGLVTAVKFIILKILKNDDENIITIIPLKGHCENVEYRIRCAVERANWCSGKSRVVCINNGMDDETLSICRRVCERFGAEIKDPSDTLLDSDLTL